MYEYKKKRFWENDLNNLDSLREDANELWKKWKFFGKNIKKQKYHPGSKDDAEWEKLFKKLHTPGPSQNN